MFTSIVVSFSWGLSKAIYVISRYVYLEYQDSTDFSFSLTSFYLSNHTCVTFFKICFGKCLLCSHWLFSLCFLIDWYFSMSISSCISLCGFLDFHCFPGSWVCIGQRPGTLLLPRVELAIIWFSSFYKYFVFHLPNVDVSVYLIYIIKHSLYGILSLD